MLITKVSRTYSRSLNTKNYGIAESWVKVEATYEAQCESGDDAVKVSEMLYAQAKQEVVANIDTIINQIKAAANPIPPSIPNAPAVPGQSIAGGIPANGLPRSL